MEDIKIKYFKEYWQDLTSENSIEEQLVHTIVYNPKDLFINFAEELRNTNLKKEKDRDFFFKATKEFSNLNIKAIEFLEPILTLIKQQFNKNNYSYLQHLLNTIDKQLENFKIGKEAVDELAEILTNSSTSDNSKEAIKHLVNLIVFDLVQKKFSKKGILEISDHIFFGYETIEQGVYTYFPHNIKPVEPKNERYQAELKQYIDNLTTKDRILSIKSYFDRQSEKNRYIFQIEGLKGNIDLKIGNVQIYNPQQRKLIKDTARYADEFFGAKKYIYCNGAVAIDTIDAVFAEQEARHALERVLDFVSIHYFIIETPIKINPSFFAIDNKGKIVCTSWHNLHESMQHMRSIELCESESLGFIINYFEALENNLPIDRKIIESAHWRGRAVTAKEWNQKILSHWICLENLLESNFKIFEVVAKQEAKEQISNFFWRHWYKIRYLALSRKIKLSEVLYREIGRGAIEGIRLKEAIKYIDTVLPFLKENPLLLEQLESVKKIFHIKEETLKFLNLFEEIACKKLFYLNKIRNKIVHNAYNSPSSSLANYVHFINHASTRILLKFIDIRQKQNLTTSDAIANYMLYEYDEFKIKLKKGTDFLLQPK